MITSTDDLPGILLVHGAWHGPWCWDAFADRLAGFGYDVRAVRLRGHHGSLRRIWHRVHDYVDDVSEAASRFPEPPVAIGHSLGGLVVAKCLERELCRAAVLLAPIPQSGPVAAIIGLSLRHPVVMARVHLTMRLRPFVANPTLVRELFFTAETPQSLVDAVWGRLQDESYLAFLDTAMVRAKPRKIQVPVLIMGAEHDRFFTIGEMRRTAAAYGTRAEIFSGMGHDMMLDQGWQDVADRIDSWIRADALMAR